MSAEQKVVCETPTPDRKPTKIDAWKYELVANAILNLLKQSPEGILFKELPDLVRETLGDQAAEVGSMSWYTTTVKLDLECRGKIERVAGQSPQRLKLSKQ